MKERNTSPGEKERDPMDRELISSKEMIAFNILWLGPLIVIALLVVGSLVFGFFDNLVHFFKNL